MDKSHPRLFGIPNRFLVLILLILGFIVARIYAPVLPHIQVAPEVVTTINLPIIGDFPWTNTMTAMLIADAIMVIIAIAVRRAIQSGSLIPSGFPGALEAVIEILYNMTESTAGKWAKKIFPWFGAITIFVLIVNWTELIPGVDTVGKLEEAREHGNPVEMVIRNVYTILPAEEHGEGEPAEELFTLIPYVRTLSTDLNFTIGLALISVIMTQVYGVQALGPGYFRKYLNYRALWDSFNNPMGVIDFGVGLLEMVSELSKIMSFSFRLFGNIFAGTVLLFVIGTLVPVFAPSIFYLLEVFVGLIQAFVFGILTMVFMSQAMAGHGDH